MSERSVHLVHLTLLVTAKWEFGVMLAILVRSGVRVPKYWGIVGTRVDLVQRGRTFRYWRGGV